MILDAAIRILIVEQTGPEHQKVVTMFLLISFTLLIELKRRKTIDQLCVMLSNFTDAVQ